MSVDTSVFGNLFESDETLSDEFKEKAKIIFESAVDEKALQIAEEKVEVISKELQEKFDEELSKIQEELSKKIDESIEFYADKFLEENKLAIEKSTKVDVVESFIGKLKDLFVESYIEIPEDRVDYVTEMEQKLQESEAKLDSQIKANIEMHSKIKNMIKESIFTEISSGLTESEIEKLSGYAASVVFESEADYKTKLEVLKENYFSKTPSTENNDKAVITESVTISEHVIKDAEIIANKYKNI